MVFIASGSGIPDIIIPTYTAEKQIRNLSGQVKEWNRGNSGQMIDIS